MSHLCFVVLEKDRERLNQVIVSDFLAKRLSESREVLGKAKSHFPRLVLTSSEQSAQSVDLVLLFSEVLGKRDQRLEAHDSDCILLVL